MTRLRSPIIARPDGTVRIERFSPGRRAEHAFVIVCFVLLAVTGFSQKCYTAPWASQLLSMLGGVDGTRYIHHIIGMAAIIHWITHLGYVAFGITFGHLRLSMFPTPQDLRDLVTTWKYRFGLSNVRPRYAFFNYQQKFQYLGLVFAGSMVMISGAILLNPRAISMFLPGHIIPAAREAHSSDALLAYLLLVVWHLYATVLSPDSVPMNKSIFTGYMTKEELKRLHRLEYDELFGTGLKR